jgi:hypothetical protein
MLRRSQKREVVKGAILLLSFFGLVLALFVMAVQEAAVHSHPVSSPFTEDVFLKAWISSQ